MSAFESGSEVWVREEARVWEKATVIDCSDDGMQVATAACERSVAIADILPREDSASAGKPVHDLTELTHLNEPSILHALVRRAWMETASGKLRLLRSFRLHLQALLRLIEFCALFHTASSD
jgi:myosin heavy subunit